MLRASGTVRVLWGLALLGTVVGCAESERAPESEQRPQSHLGLRLSAESAASIGVSTTDVRVQTVRPTIQTTGWLLVKPGYQVAIRATATGLIVPDTTTSPIELGTVVKADQQLGTLRVLVSPQEEAQLVVMKEEADTLMRQSLASLEAATARYDHVQQLAKTGPLAGKEAVTAKESLERARAAYEEVQQEFPFLPAEPYEHPLQLRAIEIRAPQGGQVVEVHVRPQQFVVQGDPLWTVADWSILWLRVPVFEGDLSRIDRTSSAEITISSQETPRSVAPTGIPQATQDGRRTVDLTYEIANADGQLRPGQAVTVSLPVGGTTEEIVVPRSAVIWDGMGSAAVYIAEPDNTFRRQRIQVGPAVGNDIVVKDGLNRGQSVVNVGAEALYGEEFKGQIQVLDDD